MKFQSPRFQKLYWVFKPTGSMFYTHMKSNQSWELSLLQNYQMIKIAFNTSERMHPTSMNVHNMHLSDKLVSTRKLSKLIVEARTYSLIYPLQNSVARQDLWSIGQSGLTQLGNGGSSVGHRAPTWGVQVLKVLGLNPTSVYWLLSLSAMGLLRSACSWEQLGAVFAASPIRHPLSRRVWEDQVILLTF